MNFKALRVHLSDFSTFRVRTCSLFGTPPPRNKKPGIWLAISAHALARVTGFILAAARLSFSLYMRFARHGIALLLIDFGVLWLMAHAGWFPFS